MGKHIFTVLVVMLFFVLTDISFGQSDRVPFRNDNLIVITDQYPDAGNPEDGGAYEVIIERIEGTVQEEDPDSPETNKNSRLNSFLEGGSGWSGSGISMK